MLRVLGFALLLLLICACALYCAETPASPSVTPLADGDGARLLSFANAERREALSALAAPTRIDLGATTLPVGEVLTKLNASGNPTTAAAGVDLTVSITLPQTAAYWELLTLLCERAHLRIKPGFSRGLLTRAPDGLSPIAMVTGPVELEVLGTSCPQLLCASGALLVETTGCTVIDRGDSGGSSTVNICTRLRLEPRVPRRLVAGGIFSWKTVVATGGVPLAPESARDRADASDVYEITLPTAKPPDGLAFDGDLLLTFAVPWRYDATLAAGDAQTVQCGRDTLVLRADRSGDAGAKATLEYPGAGQIQDPGLLRSNAAGERISGDGAGSVRRNGALEQATWEYDEADWPLHLRAHGLARLGTISLPAHSAIDFTKLPTTPAPRGADRDLISLLDATRVELPAGRITLGAALAKLGANGNTITLDLDANESTAAEVPAFTGTFWAALNMICRTWNLSVKPPSLDASEPLKLGNSELRLAPQSNNRPFMPLIPCGVLGLEVLALERHAEQRIDGVNRKITVQIRVRAEPRLDYSSRDIVPNLRWATAATDTGEHQYPLTFDYPLMPDGRGLDGSSLVSRIVIDQLPASQTTMTLTGLADFPLRQPFAADVDLFPGEPQMFDCAGVPGWLELLNDDPANDFDVSGLVVNNGRTHEVSWGFLPAITSANGQPVTFENSKDFSDPRLQSEITVPLPIFATTAYHVTLRGTVLHYVSLPFTLTIPPP